MRVFTSIALAYWSAQDRILAVVNPGAPDSWSFWLTRRLVLEMLGRLPAALESTAAKQAPAEYRTDLVAFEREAALASTQGSMGTTDSAIMQSHAAGAELAISLSITHQGETFRSELRGERGGQAVGTFARADLQRMLQMVQDEAAKGSWLGPIAAPAQTAEVRTTGAKTVVH
jgi:hypothetical protein